MMMLVKFGLVIQSLVLGMVYATYGLDDRGLDRLLADPNFLNTLTMRGYAPDVDDDSVANELMDGESFEPRDGLQTRVVQDLLLGRESPISLRDQEYLEHSSLSSGRLMMQGGAGEGHQHLKPDGSVPNVQAVKTDSILPAYCNPPNPCPIGYTSDDDCLEEFENSASFSRDYQSKQECMCDQEHMFDCPGRTEENDMDTLARSISNSGLSDTFEQLANSIQSSGKNDDKNHKVVAKKFFIKKSEENVAEKSDIGMKYAMREKKGSSHSPLFFIDDISDRQDPDPMSNDNNSQKDGPSFSFV